MKTRNFEAKHSRTYNQAVVVRDRKKAAKRGERKHKARWQQRHQHILRRSTMLDFIFDAWDWLRFGSVHDYIAFCHPEDFDFVNDVRMELLRAGDEAYRIEVTSEGRIRGEDRHGNVEDDYGTPEPGKVILITIRARGCNVRVMRFSHQQSA